MPHPRSRPWNGPATRRRNGSRGRLRGAMWSGPSPSWRPGLRSRGYLPAAAVRLQRRCEMARSSLAGLTIVGLVMAASCASAETASEIMERVKGATEQITDMRMRVTLRLDGPSGERVRSLRGFEKGGPEEGKKI